MAKGNKSKASPSIPTAQAEEAKAAPQVVEQAEPQRQEQEAIQADAEAPGTDAELEAKAEEIQAAQQRAEQEERDLTNEGAKLLKGVVASYVKGERAYRAGLLESGRLAHEFVTIRLKISASKSTRAAAIQAIEANLAPFATAPVDAGRLIRCWAVWHLLAEKEGLADKAKDVPYGTYVNAWSGLIERANSDTSEETYVLLPGMESECLEAFKEALDAKLDRGACIERVQTIKRQHESLAARQAKERERQAKEARQAEEDKRYALQRDEMKAKADVEAKAKAEAEAKAQGNAEALAKAQEEGAKARVEAERLRRERETADFAVQDLARKEALAKKEADERSKREAEAEATRKRDEERKNKANANANQPATVAPPATPVETPECRAENLLKTAREIGEKGLAKDVAEMAVELITGGQNPDEVFAFVLSALTTHIAVSKKTKRACQHALLTLNAKEGQEATQQRQAS